MANITLKKKVAVTVACNLVQVCVEAAADDEDWNFIEAAAAECFDSAMSSTWQQRDRRIVNQPVTVENFVTVTVPAYSLTEFRQHFRMSRCCFQELLSEVAPIISENHLRTNVIPIDTKLLLTLWTLGNQESFRQIGDRFGMDRGSAHGHYVEVCKALCQLAKKYIAWPVTEELQQVSSGFSFPLTVGSINCSHVRIKEPLQELDSYRKAFTSIVIQAVCDSHMRFLDVSVGWPGSMHDAPIFRRSGLGQRLDKEGLQPYHILGDSAYPLKKYLVVPFRDNGHLSDEEKRFNVVHSSSRTVVERAFARLKGKWRRLKYLDMDNMTLLTDVVTAACLLHNFVLVHDTQLPSQEDGRGLTVALDSSLTAEQRRKELLYLVT